jgi:MFS family permease
MAAEVGARRSERSPVVALAGALLVVGFGQELWARYLPEYVRALGGTALVLGVFGTLQDLLDAAYAYPGGVLADRVGSRSALLLVAGATAAGTVVYLATGTIASLFIGLLFVSAWKSFGLPATFTLIGEELRREKRIAGFTVQAVVKRIPIVIAPPIGGLLIERLGIRTGMRAGFAISLVCTVGTVFALRSAFARRARKAEPERSGTLPPPEAPRRRLHPTLRKLLVADCLVRLCEGLPAVFLVVWAIEIVEITPFQFGALQSILTATAILSYVPAVALAERVEKKPFVVATFLFFTLFPLAVLFCRSFSQLAAAYVVGGLREIGEPARKALLVDLSNEQARGRSLGLYYAIRGFVVAGAATIGGILWSVRPTLTLLAATLLGAAGTIWAAAFLPKEPAPSPLAA